jgi:hypothetical protein
MPDKTTTARWGAKGTVAMVRHPVLRRSAKPPAKLGWHVGKFIVKRKARAHVGRLSDAGQTVNSFALVYGPMMAEVFGLFEPPKRKRRAPAFVAGLVIGAGAVYGLTRRPSRLSTQ